MKAGAFLLALAWLSASTYAGYRLTERSFAWIDETGLSPSVITTEKSETLVIDIEELKGRSQEELREMAGQLTPQQLLCLRASIASDRLSAVMAGDITPQEAAAAQKCLE